MNRNECIDELNTMYKYCAELNEYNTFEKYLSKKYNINKPVQPQPKSISTDSTISNPMWGNAFFRKLLALKSWNIKRFGKKRDIFVIVYIVSSFCLPLLQKLPKFLSVLMLTLYTIFGVLGLISILSYLVSLLLCWLPDPQRIEEYYDNVKYNKDYYSSALDQYNIDIKEYEANIQQYKNEYEQYYQNLKSNNDILMKKYSINQKHRTPDYINSLINLMLENEGITSIEAAKNLADRYLEDKEKREAYRKAAKERRIQQKTHTIETGTKCESSTSTSDNESRRICLSCVHRNPLGSTLVSHPCKLGATPRSGQCVNYE